MRIVEHTSVVNISKLAKSRVIDEIELGSMRPFPFMTPTTTKIVECEGVRTE